MIVDAPTPDLLDAAGMEASQLDLRRSRCDLRILVEDAHGLFSALSSGHRFVLDLPDEPVEVDCDQGRIAQVLGSLVSNAIKYSPEGGRITIRLETRGETATVAVSDNGQGIRSDELPRLFEPFQRGHRGRHDIPGAGLGLFVVRRIVAAHGGQIEVESEIGSGSTFRVTLPRVVERLDEGAAGREARPPAN